MIMMKPMPSSQVVTNHNVRVEKVALLIFFVFLFSIHDARGAQPANPEAIKTIQTEDGDIFDCVDMYKQPAFKHPLLKDHKIQMRPSSYPEGLSSEASRRDILPTVDLKDGGCPAGTIPIHRIHISGSIGVNTSSIIENDVNLKTIWALRRSYKGRYYGATANINAYALQPVGQKQTSASLVWVLNRDHPSPQQSLLTAGWIVAPATFGDAKTRTVIIWSAKGLGSSCINHNCPGFVQISSKDLLGATLSPLSTFNGTQYVMRVHIYKDEVTGNWWLSSRGNLVGYWPKEIFDIFDSASEVHYGGFVYCYSGEQCPPMGNGVSPLSDNTKACYMDRIQYKNKWNSWVDLEPKQQAPYESLRTCYNVGPYSKVDEVHRYRFRFGGSLCPLK